MNRVRIPLFCILCLTGWVTAGPGMEIRFTGQVRTPNVKRIGVNVDDTGWDAGAITKTRAAFNFEGTMYRSIFWGPAQDTAGVYIWQDLSRPPEDFGAMERVVGASFKVLNGPAKGETGTIIAVEKRLYDDGNQQHELHYLVFDRELPANPGRDCAVMVEKDGRHEGHFNVSGADTAGFWSSGPNLSLVQGDTASGSFGQSALRMEGGEDPAFIRIPGKYTAFAEVRGTWTLRFKARALDAGARMKVEAPEMREVSLNPEWTEFAFTFQIDEQPGAPVFSSKINVTDGAVLIDDILFRHEGENPTEFDDRFVAALQDLRPGILRFLQMGGNTVENMIRPPVQKFRFSGSPWMRTGPRGGPFWHKFSMHEFFELCAYIGADPWFSLPGVLHPEELEQFMEYVAAPADTGFGKVRAELGQEEPWTEIFGEIIVEFGNEAWNQWGPFMASGYNGPEYWHDLFASARESEWYRPNIVLSSAGQNVNQWLNRQVMENAPNADLFAIATYLIHRLHPEVEERLSENDSELYRWLFGAATDYLLEHEGMQATAAEAAARGLELSVYETNHHAADGEAGSAFRNRFLQGLGGGLNMAQNHLIMLQEYGARNQAFFTLFGHVNNAYAVQDVRLFGAVLRLMNEETRVRPHFLALQALNEGIQGDLMEVEYAGEIPVFIADTFDERNRIWGDPLEIPTVRALPFAEAQQRSLILLNLSVDDPVRTTLQLNEPVVGQRAELTVLHADDLNAHNELELADPEVVLQQGEEVFFYPGVELELPPHSLWVLRWEAEPVLPTYQVRYVGKGATAGEVPVDETAYESGVPVTVAANSGLLKRTNHSFAGWNTEPDGTGMAFEVNDTFTMGDADMDLYAQWVKIPPAEGFFAVMYDGNGHTSGIVPEELEYFAADERVPVAVRGDLAKTGSGFIGWNTQADGGGEFVPEGGFYTMGAASVTLFAQWEASAGKPVRVFVLAGQSNMRGMGRINQAPAAWRPLEGVWFDDTVPGAPESFSGTWGEMAAADGDLGPELSFAAMMRKAYPHERIAIVKVSQGGTGLPYWRNPGEGGHDTLMARIDLTRDWLNAALAANEIPYWHYGGFFWMQGENEANSIESVAEAYAGDFADLVDMVRTRTGVAELPVVLGRISSRLDPYADDPGPAQQPQLDQVRAGQVSWAENDAKGGWVDTDDLPLIDNWHFGSGGQIRLGRRFAGAWFDVAESRPSLRLRRAEDQAQHSSGAEIVYEAEFSRPVTGFTAADVEILGDTGAHRVEVDPLPPGEGSRYAVRISGMFYSGVVDLRVGNGAAQADGSLSLPGITEDTAVLYAAHPAVDALLLYEPFSAPARPLHRLQSGFGWSGAGWEVQNGVSASYVTSVAVPLSYGNLWVSPAYASGGDSYNASARMLDLENTFAGFMTTRGAAAVDLPGTTLWLSYLIRPGNAGQRQRVSLLRGSGATHSDANNMVKVKRIDGTWRMVVLNNAAELDTGIAVVAGQTHLMVLRLHIGGASDVSSAHLWVDPDPESLGGADLDLSSATVSHSVTSADFKFGRIHWYPGGSANDGALDEVRLGTSYASVTPLRNTAVDPMVGAVTVTRTAGQAIKLSDLALLAESHDPQDSLLRLVRMPGMSQEGGTVHQSGRWITYTLPDGEDPAEDYFSFRVQNALGGWADGVVTVLREAPPDPGGSTRNISGLRAVGKEYHLQIYGIPGRRFTIEASSDLLNPDWRKVGEITIGEGGHAVFPHENAGPVQFYRTLPSGN